MARARSFRLHRYKRGGVDGFDPCLVWRRLGYLLIEAIAAATPGKLILGLTVCGADGLPVGIGKRLARYFLKASALLIVVPFGWWKACS